MNIKELKKETLYREYSLEIPYDEVNSKIDNKIRELIPTITLPGFRKGKAPLSIVKQKYEKNVLSEVIQSIVQVKTKDLLEEKKLKPFRQPRVDLKKYEKEKPVEIEIKIDLEPKINLKNFTELNLNKYEIILDKETIDKNYQNFIAYQKQYSKINFKRSIKKSDKVIVNINTEDKNVPDFLKEQKEVQIITDSDYQILPEISDKLIQKKAKEGDKIKLEFELSELIKSKEKINVMFNIEIISIEELVPFQINENFLKSNGVKDENELKNNLENSLKMQYNDALKQIEKKELMDVLDNEHEFDLPQGILSEEFNDIWHRLEHAKKDNKLDDDDKNLSETELKKRYTKIANRRVKLAILLQHIAKEQKISISEKELSEGMIKYASQYPGQEKKILEYFKNNQTAIESIRGPILEEKVINSIISVSSQKNKKININDYKKLEEKTFNLKRGK